jgi:hypothetical protein
MNTSLSLLFFFLVAGGPLLGDLGPTPGSVPIAPLFDKSDLVCNCFVKSVTPVREHIDGKCPGPSRFRADVKVRDTYKFQRADEQSIVVEFGSEARCNSSQPGLRQGETDLLFLKATGQGTYEFPDRFEVVTPFSSLPQKRGRVGLRKLESALAAVLLRPNRDDRMRAMLLLHGFDTLSRESIARATPLAASKDPEIACWALAILLKTKTPGSLDRVRSFFEEYQGDRAPMAIYAVGSDLAEIRDLRTLPDLKALSSSKYMSIRFGVMDALRGIKSQQAAPILIPLLDDPNRDVQWIAVSVLADIFGKQGEYAKPGGDAFFKNPSYYTDLWKNWWADQGP